MPVDDNRPEAVMEKSRVQSVLGELRSDANFHPHNSS